MRVVLVHNKKAGRGEHNRRSLVDLIRLCGHEVRWHGKRDEEWQRALDEVDLVAVAGGDGTVAKVVRAMAGSSVPIAVLPLGTANNISTALELAPVAIPELVAGWSHGRVRRVDMGIATGPWGTLRFLESLGIGLLAEGMAAIDEGRSRPVNEVEDTEARLATATDVLRRMLTTLQARPVDVTIDGEALPGHYLLLEVLNLGTAGPNLHLAPHADPSDGLLDVVLVDEALRRQLIEHLPTYRLDPQAAPALPARRARHVILRCADVHAHVDDEVCRIECRTETVEVRIEPGAVGFVVGG
jgi:diacylglycerol kinase (ATP)